MKSEKINVKGWYLCCVGCFVSSLADFLSLCLYEDQATVTPAQWTCATSRRTVMEEMTSTMIFAVREILYFLILQTSTSLLIIFCNFQYHGHAHHGGWWCTLERSF